MSVERVLFAFGGTMVMLTAVLSLFHHPYWTWATLLIGANCLQSAFTRFCPPAWLMKRVGVKTEAEIALEKEPRLGEMLGTSGRPADRLR